jgi:hypothetical protein
MSSHQNSAPGSKSAKFVAANPLAPMADPFSSSAMVRFVCFCFCIKIEI